VQVQKTDVAHAAATVRKLLVNNTWLIVVDRKTVGDERTATIIAKTISLLQVEYALIATPFTAVCAIGKQHVSAEQLTQALQEALGSSTIHVPPSDSKDIIMIHGEDATEEQRASFAAGFTWWVQNGDDPFTVPEKGAVN
jgi:hypothetical protein